MRRYLKGLIALGTFVTAASSWSIDRAVATELPLFIDTRRLPGTVAPSSEPEQSRLAKEAEAKRAAAAAEAQRLAEQQRLAEEEATAKQKAEDQRRAATEAQAKAETNPAVPAAVLALARKKAAEFEQPDPLAAARAAALLTARNKAEAEYNIRCMAAANPSAQGC